VRTLAQLTTATLLALGFLRMDDASTNITTLKRTRAQMREAIKNELGLADPFTLVTRETLEILQNKMMRLLGFALNIANPPPGMLDLLRDQLNEAQNILWRRVEMDNSGVSYPTPMVNSTDQCTVDSSAVLNMAMAIACAHYGRPDAQGWKDAVERYLSDTTQRKPPNIDDAINSTMNDAQQIVIKRYQLNGLVANAYMSTDADLSAMDYVPIQNLALAMMRERIKQDGAKQARDTYEQYMLELERRMPANAIGVVKQILEDAQRTLYYRYDVFRVERFFTWTCVPGQNLYDFDANDEQTEDPPCLDQADPKKLYWVGMQRESQGDLWYSLICGIPPEFYSRNDHSYWPSRYDVRSCIEIWPAPGTDAQKLRVKAQVALRAFAADDDEATIDDHAIYLLAVANCKAYFKQPDAAVYAGSRNSQLETYVSSLVAGSHHTARYIPGERLRGALYVDPVPTVPFPP
jgi:hypothetical protein